jgi:exodeoxyribonuclease V
MLKNFIFSVLEENFEYSPTPSQIKLLENLAGFIQSTEADDLFLLKGYAGTGKTTIVNSLIKTLLKFKIKAFLLAPTGRAAKVLTSYTSQKAFTIHKKIYRQKSSTDAFGHFTLNDNLHINTIFIVDEASMISNESNEQSIFGSGRLLEDLIEYVYKGKGCKLMLIGDTAQLPPVGMSLSPALDKQVLQNFDKTVFESYLTDVVRQSQNSGILHTATEIRKYIEDKFTPNGFPRLQIKGFPDIEKINGLELIEKLTSAYDIDGLKEAMVINRSNKRANRYNQGIRNTVLYRDSEICSGDLLMVVKNNYHFIGENENIDFIANGDIIELKKIRKQEERYGYQFVDATVKLIDYDDIELDVKIILDTLTTETPALSSEQNKELYQKVSEDYPDIKSKREKYKKIKEDPFFNALQVKFAYAVTCHKAQGGQWKNIFLDQGIFDESQVNIEYLRWLYTAVTRATSKLYFVNFKDEFFEE